MDLLGIPFASLDLADARLKDSKVEGKDSIVPKDQRRRLRQNKEDLVDATKTFGKPTKELRVITLDEVAWHDIADNCWLVIYDFVYDCTDFLRSHPGGSDLLLEYAGRDATLAFIGTGHSSMARQALDRYLIGELPPEERIFRVADGVKIAFNRN